MKRFHRSVLLAISAALAAAGACAADGAAPPGNTIAYVITNCIVGPAGDARDERVSARPERRRSRAVQAAVSRRGRQQAHARRHPVAAPGRELSPDRRAGHAALPRGRRPGRAGTGPRRRRRGRRTSRARTALAASTTSCTACSAASRTIARPTGPSASSRTRWCCAKITTASSCS